MFLIILSCAWIIGLYIGSLADLSPLLILAGFLPLPLLFLRRISRKVVILASLSVFVFFTASFYSYGAQNVINESSISYYNDAGQLEIKGIVISDPDVRDKSARLTMEIHSVKSGETWRDSAGKALVFVPRYPTHGYGDVLIMNGEPETPPLLDDFDYRGYLEHQGIYTIVSFPKVEVVERGAGNPVLEGIYRLRANMAQTLAQIMPEPQASLAQGILLGLRGNIPSDLNEEFSRSGTSHMLAISGYNLAVMAGILLAVGLWLFGRRHYLYIWLALAVIWFYTIITGLNPPVVRGAIMASIFLAAEALGRQKSSVTALALAAAVMAGISPYILGDASFQLSFLAMGGLIFIHPVISGFFKKLVENRFGDSGWAAALLNMVIDAFSVSIAAIIAVWPLIAYYFGTFSLTGPFATFLLTPVQPLIIIIGMPAALAGQAVPFFAQMLGWLLWPLLAYMVAVVKWLGGPSASLAVSWVNPFSMSVYYLVLLALVWLYQRWQKVRNVIAGNAGFMNAGVNLTLGISAGKKWLVVPLLLLAALTTFTAAAMPDSKLRLSFMDVGEGDAILVQKGSTQVLIDGGPGPQAVTLALGKQMPFWDRTIDVIILTHLHQDHLAGLVEVIKRFKVKTVILFPADYESSVIFEWQKLIREQADEVIVAGDRQIIKLGDDTVIRILNPPGEPFTGTDSDVDNNSIVVSVQEGDISFLLTGDIREEIEWELVRNRAEIDCTVLKVAHHGSNTSTCHEFLAASSPQIAVISCGTDNKYGHPDGEIIARLVNYVGDKNLYRTDLQGTITFTTDGERLWVEMGEQQ